MVRPDTPLLEARPVAAVAILDERADIVAMNDAWRSFGRSQGSGSDCIGANYYMTVRVAAGDLVARLVADGLRDLSSGRANEFEFEYPWYSETQERWVAIHATRAAHGSLACVVVTHEGVTERHMEPIETPADSLRG